jgi:hypothetical protein
VEKNGIGVRRRMTGPEARSEENRVINIGSLKGCYYRIKLGQKSRTKN